jgi:hypothetical protein
VKLTAELLAKLLAWKEKGNRGFTIQTYRRYEDAFIIVFDYALVGDLEINESNVNKNWSELIMREKKEFLAAELARCAENIAL